MKQFMKNRPPFELKGPLIIWNLALGIFSLFGFIRSFPELVHVVRQPGGIYRSLCVKYGRNCEGCTKLIPLNTNFITLSEKE